MRALSLGQTDPGARSGFSIGLVYVYLVRTVVHFVFRIPAGAYHCTIGWRVLLCIAHGSVYGCVLLRTPLSNWLARN